MDITKSVDEQMEELREALKDIHTTDIIDNTGAISGSSGTDYYNFGDQGSITLSDSGLYSNSTVVGGGYKVGSIGSNATPYFTAGTGISGLNWGAGTGATIAASPWASTKTGGKLVLEGDGADIEINGVSILDILQNRLNVMIPNPELEKEWDELKALGDQYRKLEAELKEKGEMWAKLKAMPPPEPLY